MGVGFALKNQHCCGNGKYHPSHITFGSLTELQLQQEIEEAQNNKVAYDDQPTWDTTNHAASKLIKQHF